MPWRNSQALSGEMQAPRLRSGTVRIRRMKASGAQRVGQVDAPAQAVVAGVGLGVER